MSWPDAIAYCRWLESTLKSSASTPPRIAQALRDGWQVTLPTEAQWEKAARGTDRRRFPWGNEPRRDRANFGSAGTVPAGRLACPECAFGLSDMAGNVWEWTRSPYQPYPYDPSDDRAGLDKDALWVMRGGGFADGPQLIRTTATRRGGAGRAPAVYRVPRRRFTEVESHRHEESSSSSLPHAVCVFDATRDRARGRQS